MRSVLQMCLLDGFVLEYQDEVVPVASQRLQSLVVQVGQNATPTGGDPEYTGEFIVESYKPTIETGGAVTFEATLQPASGTAPSWGTVS